MERDGIMVERVSKPRGAPRPVAVIVVARHGSANLADFKFPKGKEGLYPLKPEAKKIARSNGRRLFAFLKDEGVLPRLQKHGAYLHTAPTPYVRAVETAVAINQGLAGALKRNGVTVTASSRNLSPVKSLRFVKMPVWEYPPDNSRAAKSGLWQEDAWASGKRLENWETVQEVERRTGTPGMLRHLITSLVQQNTRRFARKPLPMYSWVSHGSGRAAAELDRPRGPVGFALSNLLTVGERKQFGIPPEIARDELVAVILHSDGSIKARHIAPESRVGLSKS